MTKDQLLINSFYQIIKLTNSLWSNLKSDFSYTWRDGFEEPIDESLLSPFVLELAEQVGYELVNGMWEVRKTITIKNLMKKEDKH